MKCEYLGQRMNCKMLSVSSIQFIILSLASLHAINT